MRGGDYGTGNLDDSNRGSLIEHMRNVFVAVLRDTADDIAKERYQERADGTVTELESHLLWSINRLETVFESMKTDLLERTFR